MRPHRLFAMIAAPVLLAGCAAPRGSPDEEILAEATVQIVTARDAGRQTGPIGVGDNFYQSGKMVAFSSLVWPTTHTHWGSQALESRWYMGDRLVVKREITAAIHGSPFHLWSNVLPLDLGVGQGRYELWANGRKLGEKRFTITAVREATPPPHLPAA